VFGYDRIIASADLTIEAAGVHSTATARVASDHLPVWADLRLNAATVELDATGT
jgi:endonuclease/exonuclease/phosphatase family metal-dependent hydrolase